MFRLQLSDRLITDDEIKLGKSIFCLVLFVLLFSLSPRIIVGNGS